MIEQGEEQGELILPAPPIIPTLSRSCGSCYTCCVALGIEELKKHFGQTKEEKQP
jgi:hypothetical protein